MHIDKICFNDANDDTQIVFPYRAQWTEGSATEKFQTASNSRWNIKVWKTIHGVMRANGYAGTLDELRDPEF